MLVKEAMNKNVKTIRPKDTVRQAAEDMTKYRIGSLVVLSPMGELIGIVTERDIMTHVVAKGISSNSVLVGDVMTKEIITVSPDETLEDAANIMTHNKIKKLPVVEEGNLVGIITASDLIAYEQKLIESIAELLVAPGVKVVGG